jgi:orotidine-5'-phosphate decarboxylase
MDGDRFGAKLERAWGDSRFVCVGLDPDPDQVEATVGGLGSDVAGAVFGFTRAIVDATGDLVAAYKPNSAFYEQFGPPGMVALQRTIAHIHEVAPEAVVILDAKRGDIEHTNEAYARAIFDVYDADAVTAQPYLGGAALSAFLDYADRGVIVLCRTSNPDGGELQDLEVSLGGGEPGRPLYLDVAARAERAWNGRGNCALVVGATYPGEIVEIRRMAPTLPFLIAGAGRQQGAVGEAVKAAVMAGEGPDGRAGPRGFVISASRSVTHAASGPGLAEAARKATLALAGEVAAGLES